MLNIQKRRAKPTPLNQEKARYVDDFGQMFVRYGSTLTMGRVLGLVLVSDGPLSLDDIAERLGVSKSGASVATRDLERLGVLRRMGTLGSRRIVYEATDDVLPIFESAIAQMREGLALVQRGGPLLGAGPAKRRMRMLAELYEFRLTETEATTERWRRKKEKK